MRTTVVPAQITTVEDTIIGNLSFMQVGILMIPLFIAVIIFVLFPPFMHIAMYKIPPVIVGMIICFILSLKIQGKVVIYSLFMVMKYNLRPKYYVFNKNEAYLRDTPEIVEKKPEKMKMTKDIAIKAKSFSLRELQQWEKYIKNPNYSFSLKPDKKGILHVAVSEIQKTIR